MEDKDLIQLCRKGDQEAFGTLVKKYKNKVFNLAFSMTFDREMADDLSQEIFIKTYMALPRFKFKSKFSTWLYQIALNHIRDFFRKQAKIKKIPLEDIADKRLFHEDDTAQKERDREEKKRRKLLYKAIATLPEKHRVILSLRDIQGFSYGDIANILKISPGTVDSRLHRARKMLREKISPFLTQKGGSHEM